MKLILEMDYINLLNQATSNYTLCKCFLIISFRSSNPTRIQLLSRITSSNRYNDIPTQLPSCKYVYLLQPISVHVNMEMNL